ncbi:MAG: ribonuclease P [Methanophagales archaeon ANME-1-THS]|nr:MAG: ribonuclease P [Methanophagales archaeon ANME-1-THS]
MKSMKVMRYVPPSLRERRRYLLFELMGEREIDKRALLKELGDSIHSLYGDVGASEIKLRLIRYHTRKEGEGVVGVLRCAHDRVEEVRASLACIHSITDARVSIRVIKTSGTIRGATRHGGNAASR